jgi:hypothetical protein
MKNQYEIDYQQGYDKANDEWLERLDKIRAEIERKANSGQWSEAVVYGMKKSISIIDKYKAESEDR